MLKLGLEPTLPIYLLNALGFRHLWPSPNNRLSAGCLSDILSTIIKDRFDNIRTVWPNWIYRLDINMWQYGLIWLGNCLKNFQMQILPWRECLTIKYRAPTIYCKSNISSQKQTNTNKTRLSFNYWYILTSDVTVIHANLTTHTFF